MDFVWNFIIIVFLTIGVLLKLNEYGVFKKIKEAITYGKTKLISAKKRRNKTTTAAGSGEDRTTQPPTSIGK